MKKLISLIVLCLIAIAIVYYSKGKVNIDVNKYFTEKPVENKDIKTNSLQSVSSVYYYDKLTDYEKEIYNKLLSGMSKLEKDIKIEVNTEVDQNKIAEDVSQSFEYIFADHPEVWYVKPDYEIKVSSIIGINTIKIGMKYTVGSVAEKDAQAKELAAYIDSIISKHVRVGMSEYEKELAIHDALARNIVYYKYTDIDSIPDEKHNAYGALIGKSAVCDGFAKAYQLILNKMGIENILVQGTAEGVAHAWNAVKIGGEYYHVDLTSDATIMGETKANMPVHVYFNITDAEILETHTIENRDKLPAINATKYNYYTKEDKIITHMDSFDYKLKQVISNNKNAELLEVKVTGIYNVPEKLVDELYRLDYNRMKTTKSTKVSYNKILDVYIIPTK